MDKSETVTIIRSLLSSVKTPVDIIGLNKMFRDEVGISIPLCGHESIIDFLNSIPDTVFLTGEYPNQVVNLVRGSKSDHIVSLVRKQKNSKQNSQERRMFHNKTKYFPDSMKKNYSKNEISSSMFKSEEKSDERNLHKHLLLCPNGATFNEMQKIVCELSNCRQPLNHSNILSITKSFPFCLFYEGKFYAVEIFKQKILNNEIK